MWQKGSKQGGVREWDDLSRDRHIKSGVTEDNAAEIKCIS